MIFSFFATHCPRWARKQGNGLPGNLRAGMKDPFIERLLV
jgi:hypothetical protein